MKGEGEGERKCMGGVGEGGREGQERYKYQSEDRYGEQGEGEE
jgi:hypothetical protein